MSTPTPNKVKYRTQFTPAQVAYLIDLLKSQAPLTEDTLSCLTTLVPLQAKITNGAITPAYITVPDKATVQLDSLGGGVTPAQSKLTKEEYWLSCYNKYKLDPTSCTVPEIQAAEEHMYIYELMTPEQQAAFEAKTPTSY